MDPATGPTLLGFDVIMIGTILVAIAVLAVVLAIYAAVTVKDPMAKRVAALNARYRNHGATAVLRGALRDPEAGRIAMVSSARSLGNTLRRSSVKFSVASTSPPG